MPGFDILFPNPGNVPVFSIEHVLDISSIPGYTI
jgi:hypothetical protein